MKILRRLLLFDALPVFITALFFFVLMLQMVDLFGNLWRYLNQDVPISVIIELQILYVPKCISYAVPISLLFSIAYTLGQLYSNNELIALLGSGVSLRYAVVPLLLFGMLLGIALLVFEDAVVIHSYSKKNKLMSQVLGQRENLNNTNVTIRGDAAGVIYFAEYYNNADRTLSNVVILMMTDEGRFKKRIDAAWAEFDDSLWIFRDARVYDFEDSVLIEEQFNEYKNEFLADNPANFQRRQKDIEEMTLSEAVIYIEELQRAGQESRQARTDYYKRIAFAFTPLIVVMLSSAIGSRFKKNILLMSLLLSLSLSVIFYVFQMMTSLFAAIGILSPVAGSFIPVIVFLGIGITMLRFIRT
ncbi:LptF/LptG family permease [Marispirochaeta sp.]|uniref:LptF/LptG family permease n=1 Tax=Marispirochaeta sp. TaxID=2038653 RepID=UPI0029C93A59|nr:LptF/LptG family permease [Marispirochaeta sp.]